MGGGVNSDTQMIKRGLGVNYRNTERERKYINKDDREG